MEEALKTNREYMGLLTQIMLEARTIESRLHAMYSNSMAVQLAGKQIYSMWWEAIKEAIWLKGFVEELGMG